MKKLHLKFCKRVLGVHSKSTNIAVFGELGRTPLVIKYWFRIKSPSFSNTLVGEAAKACMKLKLKPTIFLKYTLQLCEEEDSVLQNEVSNLQTEIFKSEKSVCHYENADFKTFL